MWLAVLVLIAVLWGLYFLASLAWGPQDQKVEPALEKVIGWRQVAEIRIEYSSWRVDDLVGMHRNQGATLEATLACNQAADFNNVEPNNFIRVCRPATFWIIPKGRTVPRP